MPIPIHAVNKVKIFIPTENARENVRDEGSVFVGVGDDVKQIGTLVYDGIYTQGGFY